MNEDKLRDWLNKRKELRGQLDAQSLFEQIRLGDINALGKGITLLESTLETDREKAQELVNLSLPHTGKSLRVGITGVPGVGKSTFIETFGTLLIEQGKKVAVLAIDPSSERSHGSILGDKTRMEKLSQNPKAFIRPSAAGDSLGGVARRTREATYLCELAGFDIILIETVGVGQSETTVHSMVDFFMLLMLSGAGDELQGIKRGIMEMADLLVVTKADGDNIAKAKKARTEYKNAMHLFPPNSSNWIPKSCISSVYNREMMEEVIGVLFDFEEKMTASGFIARNRRDQDQYWFEESLKELILDHFYRQKTFKTEVGELKQAVREGRITSFEAARLVFTNYTNKNGGN
ncbi:MAG: methylmalonyl Co-A mutase-associated GTPase MeaB [Crocinitomicaceae bacterium]|nr:methylmalonyl Co-A mutase-associated GTPase MeaB [Crocinitomicaceae bacterium]